VSRLPAFGYLAQARQTEIGCGRFEFSRSRLAMHMTPALRHRATLALIAVAM
jgi:hypothetical protein